MYGPQIMFDNRRLKTVQGFVCLFMCGRLGECKCEVTEYFMYEISVIYPSVF
jgi:hypothetical protein